MRGAPYLGVAMPQIGRAPCAKGIRSPFMGFPEGFKELPVVFISRSRAATLA